MKRIWVSVGAAVVMVMSGVAGPAQAAPPGTPSVVVLAAAAGDPASVVLDHAHRFGVSASRVYRSAVHGYAATLSAGQLSELRSDPHVAFVAPDTTLTALGRHFTPYEVPQILTRSVRRIAGDKSTTVSGNGSGSVNVNIAILDSGIATHPDLNVVGGVD